MMSTFDEYLRSRGMSKDGSAAPAGKPGQASFDNGMEGWKPPSGGDPHGGAQFESTDTGDFLPEEGSEAAKLKAGIGFTDGMYGSQVDPNRKKSTGPELQGVLDSDPEIYMPEVEHLDAAEAGVEFKLPSTGKVDQELDMFCSSTESKDLYIDVNPVCMTYEDFYCGFTADSHPGFSVTPTSGQMEKRKGAPTTVTVTCKPNGAHGELVGHLCFILPDEKPFSTYYKITCESQ
jgi:hypothetical protein